ncbi:MAG: hypothetical protein AB7P44_14610 [Steroidobacteraceae bacterium]
MLALSACGGGKESTSGDAAAAGGGSQSAPAGAGNGSAGPDTSGLAEIILGKINQDPTRQELEVTGKLLEFNVTSAKTEVLEGMGASAVVECAGVVVFDGDTQWNWQEMEPKKAGEPAKFECQVEYANQGNGWQVFGPMGIYPL